MVSSAWPGTDKERQICSSSSSNPRLPKLGSNRGEGKAAEGGVGGGSWANGGCISWRRRKSGRRAAHHSFWLKNGQGMEGKIMQRGEGSGGGMGATRGLDERGRRGQGCGEL